MTNGPPKIEAEPKAEIPPKTGRLIAILIYWKKFGRLKALMTKYPLTPFRVMIWINIPTPINKAMAGKALTMPFLTVLTMLNFLPNQDVKAVAMAKINGIPRLPKTKGTMPWRIINTTRTIKGSKIKAEYWDKYSK